MHRQPHENMKLCPPSVISATLWSSARDLLTLVSLCAAPAHDHPHGEDPAQPRVRRAGAVAGRSEPVADRRQVTGYTELTRVMCWLLCYLRLVLLLTVVVALPCSNVGANFSLIGSLAAVMWIKLLKVGFCDSCMMCPQPCCSRSAGGLQDDSLCVPPGQGPRDAVHALPQDGAHHYAAAAAAEPAGILGRESCLELERNTRLPLQM